MLAALVFASAAVYAVHTCFFTGIEWSKPSFLANQTQLYLAFVAIVFAAPFLRYAVHGYFFDQDAGEDSSGGADSFGDSD